MADIGILEACGILAALSAGLGGPIAVVKWCTSVIDRKIDESEKSQKITTDAHVQAQKTVNESITHKLNNTAQRVDAIERLRVQDVERIAKFETELSNFKDGQSRIEHNQELLKREVADAFDRAERKAADARAEIVDTIREMSKRDVKP